MHLMLLQWSTKKESDEKFRRQGLATEEGGIGVESTALGSKCCSLDKLMVRHQGFHMELSLLCHCYAPLHQSAHLGPSLRYGKNECFFTTELLQGLIHE